MAKNKIGIFGIGAIGSVIALKLNAAENEMYYYNRSPKTTIKVVHENGFDLRAIELSDAKKGGKGNLDWLIICLKEYQYKDAAEAIGLLVGSTTKIVMIRNGINLEEPVLEYASESQILACMIDCPTQLNEDGEFYQLRKPIITTAQSQLSQTFKTLFYESEIDILQVEDFKTATWKKLIESSALGGILTLTGESCWIFKDAEFVQLYERIVDEGIKVALAEGAKIESNFKAQLVKKLLQYPDIKVSSMLNDRRKGNPIELNAKNGAIARLGKKHAVKTEVNDLISLLLRYTNRNV